MLALEEADALNGSGSFKPQVLFVYPVTVREDVGDSVHPTGVKLRNGVHGVRVSAWHEVFGGDRTRTLSARTSATRAPAQEEQRCQCTGARSSAHEITRLELSRPLRRNGTPSVIHSGAGSPMR